jgi:hypothetical protein
MVMGVTIFALILGAPGDLVAVVLGLLAFALLLVLLEGIDRV